MPVHRENQPFSEWCQWRPPLPGQTVGRGVVEVDPRHGGKTSFRV